MLFVEFAMAKPEGSLTSTQYEILEAVWGRGAEGATVAEIWQALARDRSVGRTTILNHVDRLEKRGWLERRDDASPLRFVASQDRETTLAQLTGRFVDDFFGRSPSDLILNLLGSGRLKPDEIAELRRLLDATSGQPDAKQRRK
jgi:BlaI family transcriptional regulator, penicillinase repressor